VSIRRRDAGSLKVTALDANGYPIDREPAVVRTSGSLAISLLPDVLYYIIERR
jgi:hypothetical protein